MNPSKQSKNQCRCSSCGSIFTPEPRAAGRQRYCGKSTCRAATGLGAGGVIELRDGHFDGELLGTCAVGVTGDWQKWSPFTAKIKKTSGAKTLYLVFNLNSAVEGRLK